jgi:hypothetical protein
MPPVSPAATSRSLPRRECAAWLSSLVVVLSPSSGRFLSGADGVLARLACGRHREGAARRERLRRRHGHVGAATTAPAATTSTTHHRARSRHDSLSARPERLPWIMDMPVRSQPPPAATDERGDPTSAVDPFSSPGELRLGARARRGGRPRPRRIRTSQPIAIHRVELIRAGRCDGEVPDGSRTDADRGCPRLRSRCAPGRPVTRRSAMAQVG